MGWTAFVIGVTDPLSVVVKVPDALSHREALWVCLGSWLLTVGAYWLFVRPCVILSDATLVIRNPLRTYTVTPRTLVQNVDDSHTYVRVRLPQHVVRVASLEISLYRSTRGGGEFDVAHLIDPSKAAAPRHAASPSQSQSPPVSAGDTTPDGGTVAVVWTRPDWFMGLLTVVWLTYVVIRASS